MSRLTKNNYKFDKKQSAFNDNFPDPSGPVAGNDGSFFGFSRLPIELRFKIWKESFAPNRLISIGIICLKAPSQHSSNSPAPQSTTTVSQPKRNRLGNIISQYPYRLLVRDSKDWSQSLLRVNRESRRAFHEFYRIRIPLQPGAFPLLHLNPDTDILEVHSRQQKVDVVLAFFQDVVAYDPRGIGIAHLAMGLDINDLIQLSKLQPSRLAPSAVEAIKTLLCSSLQTFYACISSNIGARHMLGVLTWSQGPIYNNRAIPLAARGEHGQSETFTLLPRDPRPIGNDLTQLGVPVDPRRRVYLWRKFMGNFGVLPQRVSGPPLNFQYLYAMWPNGPKPESNTKAGFIDYVNRLDSDWARRMADLKMPLWGEWMSEEEHYRHRRELEDVAGAWIFDGDAFGNVPDPATTDESTLMDYKMVKNLSHSWPRLMVFHLSETR